MTSIDPRHLHSYASKESLEEYAYQYGGLSDFLSLIQGKVSERRFQTLLTKSCDLDDLPFDFLTAKERHHLEEALAYKQLQSNMENGICCVAHHYIAASGVELCFEAAIEDDGSCIDLRTPYDHREGKFVNLDDCVTD